MREITIRKEESGQRLSKFLHRYFPGAGNGFLYKMLRKKNILLDQKKADGKEILQEGDRIQIYFSEETIRTFQKLSGNGVVSELGSSQSMPTFQEPEIVYRDRQLLLVNKPAGQLTQKAESSDFSLTEQIRLYLTRNGQRTEEDRFFYEPGPANRLDRNTSGLVAVPLTLAAARELSSLFRDHTIDKEYLALVCGDFSGIRHLKGWYRREEATRKSMISFSETEGSKPVELICRPLERNGEHTLLDVKLLTGKTHQIRSQLAAAGFPIFGDPKYGTSSSVIRRQFLHAWQLTFPVCAEPLAHLSGRCFQAPLPNDLLAALQYAGLSVPNAKII